MEIRLDQIGDEPFSWRETRAIPVESLERDQLIGLSEVDWSGEVSRTPGGFALSARMRYSQTLQCPRCLEPAATEIESAVDLQIQPKSKEPFSGELELEEEDLGLLYVEGEILDTDPILIEQIQLNVPMRQLCRPECAGLCPGCGIDRNTERCDCENVVDPRWAGLAALRDRLEN